MHRLRHTRWLLIKLSPPVHVSRRKWKQKKITSRTRLPTSFINLLKWCEKEIKSDRSWVVRARARLAIEDISVFFVFFLFSFATRNANATIYSIEAMTSYVLRIHLHVVCIRLIHLNAPFIFRTWLLSQSQLQIAVASMALWPKWEYSLMSMLLAWQCHIITDANFQGLMNNDGQQFTQTK